MVALLGIRGSLRKASINRALLHAVVEALPAHARMAVFDELDDPSGTAPSWRARAHLRSTPTFAIIG